VYFTGVAECIIAMDSCTANVTKEGRIIVYCINVGGEVTLTDSCRGTVRRGGKLIVY
jgi:hypothetical protein